MPVITSGRFAAATSVLALAVAMGGTGYAAVKIDGNQIKKNAITSKHVKNDSLTGKDVKEATLAKVPAAAAADTAGSANTAKSVGGFTPTKVLYRSSSTTPQVIFNAGGLSIDAACTNTNSTIVLTAHTTVNASIYSDLADVEAEVILGNDLEGESFNPGDNYDLTAGASDSNIDPSIITFEYDTPAGTVITGTLATDTFNNTPDNCAVTGHVFVS